MSAVKYSSYSPLRFQVWNLIEPVISPEPGSDSEEPPPIPQEETPRAVTVAAVPVSAVRRVIFWVKVELLVRWWSAVVRRALDAHGQQDRKSTRLNSSHVAISYAVFCLKKKTRPA